jgi:hypothetical protein
LGLNDSFCMKAQMPSSLGKTCHDSMLLGMWGWYGDWNVQLGLWGKIC